jgi:glycerate kinase
MGKVPSGIGALAREFGVPVVCLTGSIGAGFEALYDMGVSAVIPIADGPITLEESMRNAEALLEGAAERLMRLLSI